MKILQAQINHRHLNSSEEYINASYEDRSYIIARILRDKLKSDLAETIVNVMTTETKNNTVYKGNPFTQSGQWEDESLTKSEVKLFILTEAEFKKLQGII